MATTQPTPNPILRRVGQLMLVITRWQLDQDRDVLYQHPQYVVISAPHTSNTDAVVGILALWAANIKPVIMIKQKWTQLPLIGALLRWLGFFGVDRNRPTRALVQIVRLFQQVDKVVIVITPEGTRGKTEFWKPGFYYIAQKAGVPIVLSFLDYAQKRIGVVSPAVFPSGDIEADMQPYAHILAEVRAKYPERVTAMKFEPQNTRQG